MAGWARLAKGYQYHAGQGGVTGQEQYAVEASGASNLPVIGTTPMLDPAGNPISGCLCRSIDSDFPEGDDATRSVTCRFSAFPQTMDSDASGSGPGSTDPNSRKINTSIESKSMDTTTCKWAYDGRAAGKVTIGVVLFKATYSVPKVMTLTQWPAFNTKFLTAVGKVNNAPFDIKYANWRKGSVYFSGISGGTRYEQNGIEQWAFDMNFSIKLLPDTVFGDGAHENDWLRIKVVDKVAGQPDWDIVCNSDYDGNPAHKEQFAMLYYTCDLNIMLTA